MAVFSKKEERDPFNYEDNVIGWLDAIKSKLNKMREVRSKYIISENNDIMIGIMPVIDDPEYLLAELEQSEQYIPLIEKMSRYRQSEWLSVRLLLKEMLGMEKEIAYLPSGKPYLADHSFHIGISHTRGFVAVIASRTHKVAIDIERIAPRVERIKERFLSEDEIANLSSSLPLIHLLLHWSAKESMFKIMEQSEVEFRTHLRILPFEPVPDKESAFEAEETRTPNRIRYLVRYKVEEEYVITYIVDN